jgi:hypothetical protein
MSELSRMFFRCSVFRLHCKESSHSAKFGALPVSVKAAEASAELVRFFWVTSGFIRPLFLSLTSERQQ